MNKLKIIIADDEPFARQGLKEYLSDIEFTELAGEAENAMQVLELLKTHEVDLLISDIQMPLINGVEMVRQLRNPPLIIFTTAYSEYALQGYELDIVDYLLKPVGFDKFYKALCKARDIKELKAAANISTRIQEDIHTGGGYCFIKCESKYEKVNFGDILFVEALHNYVALHTTHGKLVAYLTLQNVESALPQEQFIKTHKSFLVNKEKINSLASDVIVIGKHEIPLSRSFKEEVMKKIIMDTLIKRKE